MKESATPVDVTPASAITLVQPLPSNLKNFECSHFDVKATQYDNELILPM